MSLPLRYQLRLKQCEIWPESVLLTWHEFRLLCLDRVRPYDKLDWPARIDRYADAHPNAVPYLTKFGGYLGVRFGLEGHEYISNFPDPRGMV